MRPSLALSVQIRLSSARAEETCAAASNQAANTTGTLTQTLITGFLWRAEGPRLKAVGVKPALGHDHLHGGEEPRESRIEFVIVAGELLALGNIEQSKALIENAEVGVRRETVIHETPIVAVENHHALPLQMRIGVAGHELSQERRIRVDLACMDEAVEFRIETPKELPPFDILAGEHANAFNGARGKIGADRQHRDSS